MVLKSSEKQDLNILTYVLEDEQILLLKFEELFKMNGITNYHLFRKSEEMIAAMHNINASNDSVHICVIDYLLGEPLTGLDIMKVVLSHNPDCKVIVISAQTDFKIVKNFLNAGAFKYIEKNEDGWLDEMVSDMQQALIWVKKKIERQSLIGELEKKLKTAAEKP